MDQKPDIKIIRGILENDTRVIKDLNNECFPMVERMVINSGGDHEQAKDIYQEGWIIIWKKLSIGELELSCKFSTFIYAICKRIWFQEKKKKFSRMSQIPAAIDMVEESEHVIFKDDDRARKLILKHFRELSKDCQRILILHLNEAPIEDIQKIMNYQNTHYTMDRKYRCKKSLIQRITNDPKFKLLKNEYNGQIRSVF
jgi:DNA-directed RNA polymerase specialized sigma24 family protein